MADKKKILLVEDHSDIRRPMAYFLERAGYDVVDLDKIYLTEVSS